MIGGNPVTYLRANNSALPHVHPLNSVFPHSIEYFLCLTLEYNNNHCCWWCLLINAGTYFEYGELCWKGRHASAGG